jgi:hypothetical protein
MHRAWQGVEHARQGRHELECPSNPLLLPLLRAGRTCRSQAPERESATMVGG